MQQALWRVVLSHTESYCLFFSQHSVCSLPGLCSVSACDEETSVLCMTYVQLFEDWVLLDPWEHDSHGVGPILQEGDLHSVHVVGQFLDISLQLCKG